MPGSARSWIRPVPSITVAGRSRTASAAIRIAPPCPRIRRSCASNCSLLWMISCSESAAGRRSRWSGDGLFPAREDRSASSRRDCPAPDDGTSAAGRRALRLRLLQSATTEAWVAWAGDPPRHLLTARAPDCSTVVRGIGAGVWGGSAFVAAGSLRLRFAAISSVRRVEPGGGSLPVSRGRRAMLAFLRIEPNGPR